MCMQACSAAAATRRAAEVAKERAWLLADAAVLRWELGSATRDLAEERARLQGVEVAPL